MYSNSVTADIRTTFGFHKMVFFYLFDYFNVAMPHLFESSYLILSLSTSLFQFVQGS